MKFLIVCFSLCLGFCTPVLTAPLQNSENSINRTELFKMVDDSLYFILSDAVTDTAFLTTSGLTDRELQSLGAIIMILHESRNLRYFQEKQITPFINLNNSAKEYRYIYFDVDNIKQVFETTFSKGPELIFSSDQSLFKLNPNEPIRTAMTYPDFEADIYINLNLINQKNSELTFSSIVSLLIHEYGHKITSNKDQAAIDSAAARVATFVKNKISKVAISINTTVYFMKYDFLSPLVRWIQSVMNGTNTSWYMNMTQLLTNQTKPLLLNLNRQGFYIWSDDGVQIKDLRNIVFNKIELEKIIQFEPTKGIVYAKHNTFLSENIQVSKKDESVINVAWTGAQFHEVIPYMNSSILSESDVVNVQGLSFSKAGPVGQIPVQLNVDIDLKDLSSATSYNTDSNVKYYMPRIEGELSNFNKSVDLTFDIKFNGPLLYIYDGGQGKKTPLWPTALIKTSYGSFQVVAEAYDAISDIYHFRIKNAQEVLLSKFQINQVHLRVNYFGLVDEDSYIIGQVYLKKPVTIDLGSVAFSAKVQTIGLSSFEQVEKEIRFRFPTLKNISAINLTVKHGVEIYYKSQTDGVWSLIAQFSHVKNIWIPAEKLDFSSENTLSVVKFNLKNLKVSEETLLTAGTKTTEQKKQVSSEAEVIELALFDNALNKYEVKLDQPIKIKF